MPFHLQLGLDKWEQGTAITAKLIELSHTSCLASFYHSHTVSTFITNDSFSRIFGFFFCGRFSFFVLFHDPHDVSVAYICYGGTDSLSLSAYREY